MQMQRTVCLVFGKCHAPYGIIFLSKVFNNKILVKGICYVLLFKLPHHYFQIKESDKTTRQVTLLNFRDIVVLKVGMEGKFI